MAMKVNYCSRFNAVMRSVDVEININSELAVNMEQYKFCFV